MRFDHLRFSRLLTEFAETHYRPMLPLIALVKIKSIFDFWHANNFFLFLTLSLQKLTVSIQIVVDIVS